MKAYLALATAMVLTVWMPSGVAEEACDLDCLICEAVMDPAQYQEGAMKAMKYVVPGRDNWLFRSEFDLANQFGMPEEMHARFATLIETFRAQGTTVVIVLQPTRGLMHRDKVRKQWQQGFDFELAYQSYQAYRKQLQDLGAVVPDLSPLIDNPPENYFFRRDHHWTPAGARVTAELVANRIRSLSVYEELTLKRYITEPSLLIPKDGTMNTALRRLCGNNFSFQYVQGFQTVPEASGEDALFGDDPIPEVVLVGTSNSAARDDERKNFNFDGALKELLELDLLNYALAGAGQDGALIQYLNSEDFDPQVPPRLLIWELPVSFQLESELTYRQLIPAVKGGCATAEAKPLQVNHQLPALKKGERVEILSNTGKDRQFISGAQNFLELNFSKPHVKDFYVIAYYDNGQRDKVWFRREAIVDGYRYLLALSDHDEFKNSNLLSVFLEPSEDLTSEVGLEVSVCG